MIKVTDKKICNSPAIFVSSQVYNDERKAKRALEVAYIIGHSYSIFQQLLNLPQKITFRLASFKGRRNGCYHRDGFMEVRYNLSWDRAMTVLSHEYVHAEQFHEKRLAVKNCNYYWNGKKNNIKGSTYNSYRKQPWEQEAFGREKELSQKVLDILDKSR